MRRNRDGFSARKEFNASEKKTDAEAMMVMAKLFPAKDQVKRSFRGKRAVLWGRDVVKKDHQKIFCEISGRDD